MASRQSWRLIVAVVDVEYLVCKAQCDGDEVWTVLFYVPLKDIKPLADVEAYSSLCVLWVMRW